MTAEQPIEAQPPVEGPCNRTTPCDDCQRGTTFDGQPRCTAWSSQRHHRCERAKTPGATVCASHGSSAPQVRRNAQLRLLNLVDPAIATLQQEMNNPKNNSSDRQRAANSILDRAGMARRTEVDHGVAQALLVQRMQEMIARRGQLPEGEGDVVDGEVVSDLPDERMEA
jgi:hypothetical protein